MKELMNEWRSYLKENKLLREAEGNTFSASWDTVVVNRVISYCVNLFKKIAEDLEVFRRLPLHVRTYIYFLGNQTQTFSEQYLTPEEVDALSKIAYDILQGNFLPTAVNKESLDANFVIDYIEKLKTFKKTGVFIFGDESSFSRQGPVWTKLFYTQLLGASTTGYMDMSGETTTIKQKFINTNMGDSLTHFLGRFTLTYTESGVIITDLYDFDESIKNLKNLKQQGIEYNFKYIIDSIKPLITKITGTNDTVSGGNFYNLLFRINEFIHSSGYKGYPVKIKLQTKIDLNLLNNNISKAETSEKLRQHYSKYVSKLPDPEQSQTKIWSADSVRKWNSLTADQKSKLLKAAEYYSESEDNKDYEKGDIAGLVSLYNDSYIYKFKPPLPKMNVNIKP